PDFEPLPDSLKLKVSIKVGDNITTDHIMPAGAKILPLRSNIYAISEYVFNLVDPEFVKRAKEQVKEGFSLSIVGGENYGQGSSREHAALAPRFLGVRVVIAKSFARIHHANLVNFGILPLELENPSDFELLNQGDVLQIENIHESLKLGKSIKVLNESLNKEINCKYSLTPKQVDVLIKGGLLSWVKSKEGEKR
ncbi:MAG: aconitate hydratase, partial [Aquificaceae bacterium]|nr:aconitate hydratase [Aquificaceae bacterium]MDW8237798.1 aconitate hydratase [Aquificaceae bacterium]